MTSFEDLVRARIDSEEPGDTESERMESRGNLRTELGACVHVEATRAKAAVDSLGDLQANVRVHLNDLGNCAGRTDCAIDQHGIRSAPSGSRGHRETASGSFGVALHGITNCWTSAAGF